MREPKKFTPEWFRYFRFVRKLTMKEAGQIVGVSHVTWHSWEKGLHGIRKGKTEVLTQYLKANP